MNINNKFISFVLYSCNDQNIVIDTIRTISNIAKNISLKYEIIILVDKSSDKTLETVTSYLENSSTNSLVIKCPKFYGKEAALNIGISKSAGDLIYCFESCCLDYPIDLLSQMRNMLKGNTDIIAAAPKKTSYHSRIFYKLMRFFSTNKISSTTTRLILFSRKILNTIFSYNLPIITKLEIEALGFNIDYLKYEPISKQYRDKRSFLYKLPLAVKLLFHYANFFSLSGIITSFSVLTLSALLFINGVFYFINIHP